jgi:autotransporter-associated beta strand protein
LNFAPGSDGVYENAISGFGTVLVSGSGVVSLSGALTYEGDTVVSGGTLRLAAANGTAPVSLLPSFTDVRLDMGAALDINGSTQTVNSLSDSLYGGGGTDFLNKFRGFADIGNKANQTVARALGGAHGLNRKRTDFGSRRLRTLSKLTNFGRHNGKALAVLACTGGLNRSVKREQIGLAGNFLNDRNFASDDLHGLNGFQNGITALFRIDCGLLGNLFRLVGVLSRLFDVGGDLLHRGGNFTRGSGLLRRALAQLFRTGRHLLATGGNGIGDLIGRFNDFSQTQNHLL